MCSLLFSLLYNYWDRIGDILALYFLPYMASDKVYFGKVIDKFNCAYTSSPTLGSCPHEPKYIMQMVVCEDTNHWG